MVFDPPWSPEMMSEDAKFALGLLNGLAMRFAGTAPATLQPELQPESSYNDTMCPFGGRATSHDKDHVEAVRERASGGRGELNGDLPPKDPHRRHRWSGVP